MDRQVITTAWLQKDPGKLTFIWQWSPGRNLLWKSSFSGFQPLVFCGVRVWLIWSLFTQRIHILRPNNFPPLIHQGPIATAVPFPPAQVGCILELVILHMGELPGMCCLHVPCEWNGHFWFACLQFLLPFRLWMAPAGSLYVWLYHFEMNGAWHDMNIHELSEFWTIILDQGHCFIFWCLFSFQFHVLGLVSAYLYNLVSCHIMLRQLASVRDMSWRRNRADHRLSWVWWIHC